MDLGLEGKVILITGGALGIGAAISHACAREGAIPVIINRDSEAAQNFLESLRRENLQFEFLATSLGAPETCRVAVEHALKSHHRIDGLVNNAGANDGVGLEHGTPDAYMESVQRNLWHYYSMAHYALPALKESRGSILNISSKVAFTGQGGTSGYASAKGAQVALTREWAVELLPYGIRVNSIIPAEVMTPLYKRWLSTFPDPEAKVASIVRNIPLGHRMTEASEIAAMAVFLLSAQSGHTTGQHIFVDGGYVHLDRTVTAV